MTMTFASIKRMKNYLALVTFFWEQHRQTQTKKGIVVGQGWEIKDTVDDDCLVALFFITVGAPGTAVVSLSTTVVILYIFTRSFLQPAMSLFFTLFLSNFPHF